MPARCRLYLITPAIVEPGAFARTLGSALAGGGVACLQLRLGAASDGTSDDASDDRVRRAARALMPVAHAFDVAFLIDNNPRLAAELGADGVHLEGRDADPAGARRLLGPDRIVGIACGTSRHLAIEAAEAGADYVALDPDPDLIAWWSETMVVPAVAQGNIARGGIATGDVTLANVAALAAAGADFIAVGAGVWDHEAGPAAAIGEFNAAIAKVLAG